MKEIKKIENRRRRKKLKKQKKRRRGKKQEKQLCYLKMDSPEEGQTAKGLLEEGGER